MKRGFWEENIWENPKKEIASHASKFLKIGIFFEKFSIFFKKNDDFEA